jgi:predicted dehydrogenase
MPPPSLVRIAIIGQGHIGQAHVSAVRDVPSAVLACIVDQHPPAGAVSADQPPFFASIEEMLQSIDVDAAIVCTPDHTHVEFSKQLLQAGIDVLCEKPICTDVSGGLELVC